MVMVTSDLICFMMTFIFGISLTARYYVGYTYSMEMQPMSHYVLVSTTQFVCESFTYLINCLYFWKISDNWKFLQLPNFIFMISGLVFLSFMPETPRFLLCIKDFEQARATFAWIGKINGLPSHIIKQRLSEITFDGETHSSSATQQMEIEELDETSVNKSDYEVNEHKPDKNLRRLMRGGQQTRFSFNYEP